MGKSATSQDASLQASETTSANAVTSNADALTALASQQNSQANTLFNESNPGFVAAQNFYQTLASGDPYAISTATAPAAQQIAQATAGAKDNIMNNSPAGGTKALALENADVKQGEQVGKIASQGYLGSFNALAKLGAQGIGESTSMKGEAISGYGAANQGYTGASNIQAGIIQQNLQQKGATMAAYTTPINGGMKGSTPNYGSSQSQNSGGGGAADNFGGTGDYSAGGDFGEDAGAGASAAGAGVLSGYGEASAAGAGVL
jgi:hypothetical protein